MHYAIQMADGSVSIMETVGDATADECLAKWHPDLRAGVVSFKAIDPANLPQDRVFRNAWRLDGEMIAPDVEVSKVLAAGMVRDARAPKLAALDIAAIRSIGDAKALAAVEAEKQVLRDAPADARIASAATVDDLRAAVVAIVGEMA